ncbi:MAG: helix-turn-helix transcriptional regulator [Marinobacterium sp.]|nr:helix-turn-helix transcriptional regulator [Marinobacterium sp.]
MNSQVRTNHIAHSQGDHRHSYGQILLGWRGQMDCELDAGGHRLQTGLALAVPGDTAHYYQGLSADCELLVLDLACQDPFLQALEQSCQLSLQERLYQPGLLCLGSQQQALLSFAATQLQQQPTSPLIHTQLLSLLLTQLCLGDNPGRQVQPASRLDLTRLHQLIDQQRECPPDNRQLAAAMNLSESHFYYLCQQQLGMPPQRYLQQRRMHYAHQQLTGSDIPLQQLAAQLGFADSSSFNRAFRRCFQLTPGAVRRASRA